MQPPSVTVLMPCRNAHAGFLREALESVFAQTIESWELLLVDDASDDPRTLDVLAELARRGDPRVRVAASASPHITGAVNTGMRLARTPFVCTLHCDDLLEEHALETLSRTIDADRNADFFYSSRIHIDEQGRVLSRVYRAEPFESLNAFLYRCPVKQLHCWRVSAALAIGGMDESFGPHGGDDYDFAWSMAEAGYIFRVIPQSLYRIRDHREHYRLTTHVPLDVQVSELERIFAKHGVPRWRARREILRRKRDYLRQALYANAEDRQRKEAGGHSARAGWRESYD